MDWVKLAVSLLVCQAAGAVGAVFTARKIPTWYASLRKPPFNPPSWVFGPVWTLLYLMMGLSLDLVWKLPEGTPGRTAALVLFFLQLALNSLWSYLFFGRQKPWTTLGEMALLWAAILLTLLSFRPLSAAAAWLLVPYLA